MVVFLKKTVMCALCVVFLCTATGVLYAQESNENVSARRAQLERELAQIEIEIAEQQSVLEAKQEDRVSLERDIAILDAEIKKARLSIRARNLDITRLTEDIGDKKTTITKLDEKLAREKESLAQLLRKTNEIDDFSLIEVMLGSENLSAFFEDVDSFTAIQSALGESFIEIEETKGITAAQKKLLEERRAEEVELRTLQELQKAKIEAQEQEKQEILRVTKGIESAYQSILTSKEKTAAQIRTELFTLRGTAAIPFERALQYANEANAKTGVRPALILGVIAEESNLGENTGSCNYKGNAHPERDEPIFIDIVRRLGLDPDRVLVSCAPWYGYGGAMGPAQFIPSTWILYEERIARATGQNPPSPWDPRTAFMASALLLMDNGADRGGWSNERLAALRYFAGWKNAEKPSYAFYGDEVMELTAKYQRQIDILESS